MKESPAFATLLLDWFDQFGRKHLPWQKDKNPYRVWVSEIMLQQTQVSTVIPYFERFMQRFPDVSSLALAAEDDVLHLWAGLGYYSRARNLHQTAKKIVADFAGKFPDNLQELQSLPGIGRSTAGAILALAFKQRATILDGNVKRVLIRFHAIQQAVNDKHVEKNLWQLAEKLTPILRCDEYTQAIMDLGATVCTRSKPHCGNCPLSSRCEAYKHKIVDTLPMKKTSLRIPTREATFLILQRENNILLCKRSPIGIWGGLWSLPEIDGSPDESNIHQFCQLKFNVNVKKYTKLASFRHTFSHYHLHIHPVMIVLTKDSTRIMEAEQQIWYNATNNKKIGMPKPIQTILRML